MLNNNTKREQHYQEVRSCISKLSTERPQYVKEARERAENYSGSFSIDCVICLDGTKLDILHIFPPINPDPIDSFIDTDLHVKCPKCGHEDWFTIQFRVDQVDFKEMFKQGKHQRKNQMPKKRRKRRKPRKN
ncbi:MAG: hypothetical protein OXM61_07160 [Candidatus Poribacteria bacterium]|nr:hypothetical protein [Candidatus Poribacteria bacterium]